MSAPWARAFRLASRARGERAIHAEGLTLTGSASFPGGAGLGVPLFDRPGRCRAVLRFSRALGLPGRAPDFLGLAVRLLDAGGPGAHQDLLLDTGAPWPLLRMLPLPSRDLLGSTCSSLLPYRIAGRRRLLAAQPMDGLRVVGLDQLPAALPVRLQVVVATRSGPWQPVGEVVGEDVLPAPAGRRLRYDPYRDGAGLVPVGRLNAWRRGAYAASHVGPDA